MENSLAVHQMLNIELPYDPAVPLLGVNLRQLKTFVHTEIYIQMFRAALFICNSRTVETAVSSQLLNG